MAFADIFKTRRSSKIHQRAWNLIWERVKTPPSGDAAARELHAVFVGTLLYATRYQAALASGMESSLARTVALRVVAQAGFDEELRERVLSVFAGGDRDRASGYAEKLTPLVAAVVEHTEAGGGAPEGGAVAALLAEVKGLQPVLAEQLAPAG